MPVPVQGHLTSIRRHGLRVTKLIEDMLEFARTSRTAPILQSVDIQSIVASVMTEFSAEIQRSG